MGINTSFSLASVYLFMAGGQSSPCLIFKLLDTVWSQI